MQREFDHIVVLARDLESGLDHVVRQIGVSLPPGGSHPLMGTHNHVIRLGEAAFLEVIAPDPTAPAPGRPRWFGLDAPPEVPKLGHWVVRVPDMAAVHPGLPASCGPAIPVTRGALRWLLTVPEDGSLPEGGVFPSVIEWQTQPLPPRAMPGAGLTLEQLDLRHPEAGRLEPMIRDVLPDPRVTVQPGSEPRITAIIGTPDGPKRLE